MALVCLGWKRIGLKISLLKHLRRKMGLGISTREGSNRNPQDRRPAIGPRNRYIVIRSLNEGTFGRVVLAIDTVTNMNVAIKFIERGPRLDKNYVTREIINHRGLWHHHVIGFHEVFLTDNDLCIVMEYAPGGDLHEYVKNQKCLSEATARWYFQQLVVAVDYCHKKNIVLRDVKLENLLLDRKNNLKLCDFGFSKSSRDQSAPKTCLGTPLYIAPELLRHPEDHAAYNGKKVDIWTCGVSLYVMIYGHYPFDNPANGTVEKGTLLQRIKSGKVDFPTHQNVNDTPVPISEGCRHILSKILERYPEARFSMEDIKADPWFLEGLPSTVSGYNERLCSVDEDLIASIRKLQSESEIESLVLRAGMKA